MRVIIKAWEINQAIQWTTWRTQQSICRRFEWASNKLYLNAPWGKYQSERQRTFLSRRTTLNLLRHR